MRFLFLGDIVGRTGRDAVIKSIPYLRRTLSLDFVVANAENASHGFGLSPSVSTSLLECGIERGQEGIEGENSQKLGMVCSRIPPRRRGAMRWARP